jgi:hypothetical protein
MTTAVRVFVTPEPVLPALLKDYWQDAVTTLEGESAKTWEIDYCFRSRQAELAMDEIWNEINPRKPLDVAHHEGLAAYYFIRDELAARDKLDSKYSGEPEFPRQQNCRQKKHGKTRRLQGEHDSKMLCRNGVPYANRHLHAA